MVGQLVVSVSQYQAKTWLKGDMFIRDIIDTGQTLKNLRDMFVQEK